MGTGIPADTLPESLLLAGTVAGNVRPLAPPVLGWNGPLINHGQLGQPSDRLASHVVRYVQPDATLVWSHRRLPHCLQGLGGDDGDCYQRPEDESITDMKSKGC